MKTIRVGLCVLLILSLAFLPLGVGLCACFGLQFELASDTFEAWLPALLALGLMILCLLDKDPGHSEGSGALLAAAAPLALLHALILWQKTNGDRSIVLLMILCVFCSLVLSVTRGKPKAWRMICLILAGILFLPFCYFSVTSIWMGGFEDGTTTRTLASPDGQYEARLIFDPESVNRHLYVEVRGNWKFNAGLFTVEKMPQIIIPDPRTGAEIQMAWRKDSCLVINGMEYPIE